MSHIWREGGGENMWKRRKAKEKDCLPFFFFFKPHTMQCSSVQIQERDVHVLLVSASKMFINFLQMFKITLFKLEKKVLNDCAKITKRKVEYELIHS